MAITLRPFADGDLDALFVWESDPRAVEMAAFTRADPFDRGAFDAHYERVRGGTDTGFAPGVGAEVVEHIYRLDQQRAPSAAHLDCASARECHPKSRARWFTRQAR